MGSSTSGGLLPYAGQRDALLTAGTSRIVANPGTVPHPGYLDLADVVVVFESRWEAYQRFVTPDWLRSSSAERLSHLVYDVPAAARLPVPDHAGSSCFTEGRLPNPWDRLPLQLL